MSNINLKKLRLDRESHLNYMAGKSWDITDPILKLQVAASSCFFGEPMYYQDSKDRSKMISRGPKTSLQGEQLRYLRDTLNAVDPQEWRSLSPVDLLTKAIDDALNYNIKETLNFAITLRNKFFIRITPQVIMVRAANHPKGKGGIIKPYADHIIKRADEPAIQLAYQLAEYGKPVPNALKKSWKAFLEKQNDYILGKYKMENRMIKTVDVVRFAHAYSANIDKLMKGQLKQTRTWENEISQKGSTKENWLSVISKMGHMALLRNIRNFLAKEIEPSSFLPRLLETVEKGKQLPFRYYSAWLTNREAPASILDALSDCLDKSLVNVPKFKGKTAALSDNSGSAHETFTSVYGSVKVSDIANLTALIAAINSDDGYIGIFGDSLRVLPVSKKVPLLNQLEWANQEGLKIGQQTEHGIWLFFDEAIFSKTHYDNIFIFSDMQAGHGGLYGRNSHSYADYSWNSTHYIDVAKLIQKYRTVINKEVNVFLVQVAGYQDTIIPEYYYKTYILGGWSAGLFQFAAQMINMVN